MRLLLLFFATVAACSEPSSGSDLASVPDLASADLRLAQSECSSQPPSDGQACGGGCAAGTQCAGYTAADLKCYQTCDVSAPSCPCGRRCVAIASGGAACLPANGPGERCGNRPGGTPYGYGTCAQGLVCAGPAEGRYCVPTCVTSTTCAPQTSCKAVVDNNMVTSEVCWFNSSTTADAKAIGDACTVQTFCVPNALCAGGACRQQCGGPADPTCATGTCTPLKDASDKTFAYVCM